MILLTRQYIHLGKCRLDLKGRRKLREEAKTRMISESILLVWFSNPLAELLDYRHISSVVKYPT